MTILKIILALALLICLLDMPYGYYQFVRFVGMSAFAYLAYEAYNIQKYNEVFLFISLLLLFQPFVKVALGRGLWNAVDVLVAIYLTSSIFFTKEKNETPKKSL